MADREGHNAQHRPKPWGSDHSGPLRRVDVDPEGRAIIDPDPGRDYRFEGRHIFRLCLAHPMATTVSPMPRHRSTTIPGEAAA